MGAFTVSRDMLIRLAPLPGDLFGTVGGHVCRMRLAWIADAHTTCRDQPWPAAWCSTWRWCLSAQITTRTPRIRHCGPMSCDRERPGCTVTTPEALMIFENKRGQLAYASPRRIETARDRPVPGQRSQLDKHEPGNRLSTRCLACSGAWHLRAAVGKVFRPPAARSVRLRGSRWVSD